MTNGYQLTILMEIFYVMILFGLYAAAAAKSLQSCPTVCDPIDSSPGI